MTDNRRLNDPYSAFNFKVEINGVTLAGFSECSGLTSETEIIEYRNGDEDSKPRKLPGLKRFSNIVLKRGITLDKDLWKWYKRVLDGMIERRAGSIILLDDLHEEALRWNFYEGWPCKISGPNFNANNNETAIEYLEIAVESIELIE